MRAPAPFRAEGEHLGIELPGARALFTTRRGGVSEGPYASLNLGVLTDDDPARVAANQERLAELVGIPRARHARGMQVHGARVRSLAGPPDPEAPLEEADGQVTAEGGVAAVVLVADCLPIAVAGDGAVAMLHAGWRGLAEGVVEAGVAALRAQGAREPLAAAIGPGIGRCCYQVGEEVHERFSPELREGDRLDLKAAARRALATAGVAEVHDCGLCTHCSDPSLFFSHRRDRGVTGRQAGVAWRA